MKIDIKTEESLFIELGDYTYYIDNSTGENILQRWLTKDTCDNEQYLEVLPDYTLLNTENLKTKAA